MKGVRKNKHDYTTREQLGNPHFILLLRWHVPSNNVTCMLSHFIAYGMK